MKTAFAKGKKKVVATVAATTLGLTVLGGSAFAFKDEWNALIEKSVAKVASIVYKGEIEKEVDSYGNKREGDLRTYITNAFTSVKGELEKHKNSEINRGKAEIDSKYQSETYYIDKKVNEEAVKAKAEQAKKTEAEITAEKQDMDKAVEEELNKQTSETPAQ